MSVSKEEITEYSDKYIRETIYYLEELRNKARGYAVIWLDVAIDAVSQYRDMEK